MELEGRESKRGEGKGASRRGAKVGQDCRRCKNKQNDQNELEEGGYEEEKSEGPDAGAGAVGSRKRNGRSRKSFASVRYGLFRVGGTRLRLVKSLVRAGGSMKGLACLPNPPRVATEGVDHDESQVMMTQRTGSKAWWYSSISCCVCSGRRQVFYCVMQLV
jgi:hypothetical protein